MSVTCIFLSHLSLPKSTLRHRQEERLSQQILVDPLFYFKSMVTGLILKPIESAVGLES